MWPTTTGPTAFVSILRFYFAFLHPRSCSHVSSKPTTHSTCRKRRRAVKTVNISSCITPVIVQLCCWLCRHLHSLLHLLICIFSLPLWRMLWEVGLPTNTLSFLLYSFISVSHGWSGNVLVKCFNNVSLSSVCAPNTVVCWELLGYWPKNKIYTVF